MSYQVIARRWRPQTFDEVVSQEHVSTTLKNSIKSGRISHAYIFTGPRGVGKTTTARILAKSLNCISGPTETPCGVCENCREITSGTSFDVIEIDGASNNSVDNIRELREKVAFAPAKSRYKIYIIDEVHMLSIGAFNALLKTLEEPPEHVVFIFATTEVHKVPETILSRCQKFFFRKFDSESIVKHLKKIISADGYNVSERVLYSIARSSAGAMRDAQSLLEQVLSFSDGSENDSEILSLLGVMPIDSYIRILKCIAEFNRAGIVTETDAVVETGADTVRYVDGFCELLRALRLVMNSVTIEGFSGFSSEEIARIMEISSLFADEEISAFFKIMKSLTSELKYAENEKVYLEMAFLDMVAIKERPSVAALIKMIENGSSNEKKKSDPPFKPKIDAGHSTAGTDKNEVKADGKIISGPSFWESFLESIRLTKHYLYNKLVICKTEYHDNVLQITVPRESNGAVMGRVRLSLDLKDIQFIEEQLKTLTSQVIKIDCDHDDVPPLPEHRMIEDIDHNEVNSENNVVKKIVNIFHGQIIEKKGED